MPLENSQENNATSSDSHLVQASTLQETSTLQTLEGQGTRNVLGTPSIRIGDAESDAEVRQARLDDLRSDDEFHTASECTLRHSPRSSVYDSASECEARYSPWWDYDKKIDEDISKEKMVLAVGCPQLPAPEEVLKESPIVPAGKIVHEVIETTHIRVEHSHKMGVKSFVLSSETVRDEKRDGFSTSKEQTELPVDSYNQKEEVMDDYSELKKELEKCGNWLQLKILEITPELTKLGNTLQEAVELQKAHDEVLRQIKSKQSPVEELLRQADQLIATQKPRAEVYAAMAETLGRAWRDINFNLELRKQILDLNVQYHNQASEFFNKVRTLEQSCTDTVIPIEIQAVKDFLTSIHDLRRNLLESLMAALQAGNSLLGKLKELGAEGTLDSRPDHIRQSVNKALSQVQSWLDDLHCKREDVEAVFNRRKLQLEQCLALAILAADLRQLEEAVNNSRNRLANADQLGDSIASAELLQVENKKLLPEAQLLQEKALKITKATEQLLQSGCFAGEEATKQSYAILSLTSDYLTEVQNRNTLLERVVEFFRSAQSAFNKLSHLEEQIRSSNLKTISPDVNSECAKSIEEITSQPIADGYAILDAAGRGSTGTEGVRRTVEELENNKIRLNALFAAQREENLRINRALESFFNSYQSINNWLTSIADAFLQSHQNMGNDLPTANDFMNLHIKLHTDLQGKGNEINALLLTLPPIVEYLDDERRHDVDVKVEEIHNRWMKLKGILENRLDLGRIYVKFHKEADIVNSQIDKLEDELRSKGQDIDDEMMKDLEIKWESIEPLYQSAKNTGLTFINDTKKVSEPHLDSKRACGCVEAVLEKLAGRQLQVTRNWQTFYTDVIEKRELLVKLEEAMVESTRTINWVTKLEAQLYPVITTNTSNAKDLAFFVKNKLDTILPDIKRAQNEVDQKIKTAEMLISKVVTKDEKALNVKNKLSELNHKLIEITNDFQMLLQMLISYFNSINDLDHVIDKNKISIHDISQNNDISSIKSLMSEHESSKLTVNKMLDSAQNDRDRIIQRILKQEPSGAAEHDIAKLKHIFDLRMSDWKNHVQNKRELLEKQYAFCQFDEDLNNIYNSINSLEHKNNELKSRYGKSLEEAQMSSSAYAVFEKTIQDLDIKIKDFIEGGNKLLSEKHSHSPLIQKHIRDLEERWDIFKKQIHHTRYLIDQSIKYFQLVNEVNEWFKQGSRLLISIGRRSALVKSPKEAEELLNEITTFLKPGEEKQNQRIHQLTKLAESIYGKALPEHFHQVLDESREMFKSFSLIQSELDALNANLLKAEQEKLRQQKEQEELAKKVEAMKAAEEAKAAAEKAKAAAEIIKRENEMPIKLIPTEIMHDIRQQSISVSVLSQETKKPEVPEVKEHEIHRIIQVKHEETPTNIVQKTIENVASKEVETLESPVFITPLTDAVIQEGSKFSFICQVKGLPVPVVTWYKAGIPIQNNPDYQTSFDKSVCTLTIEETFSDDSARYTCKAINAVGTAETSAYLSVKETEPQEQLLPPSFTKYLEPAFVKEGSSFEFHCKVEGNPLPNVQWFKGQECIDYSPGYNITYNNGEAILKFESVDIKDKDDYTCKAANQIGSAQSTASLAVIPVTPTQSPAIISPLSNIMARAGQKIKLECEITGLPIPDLVWYQNGHVLQETHELKIQRDGDKATLVIYEAFPKDAGTYRLTATNIVGEASSSCSVSVKGRVPTETSDSEIASDMEPVKPSIQLPLVDLTVSEGSRVRLDCVIIGQPEPEVIWYHNNRPVKESSDFQLLFQGDRCSLVIHEAFSEDGGEYKVVALNSAGEASSNCTLNVKSNEKESESEQGKAIPVGYPPKFNKLLADVLVSEGEKVIFEGNVSASPKPEIKWFLNNLPVVIDDHIELTQDDEGNIKLEINNVKPQDKGVYTVKVINEHGDAKCFAQLIVKSSKVPETIKYEEIKSAPVFTEVFKDKSAFENTSTKFECIVNGKPKPKVKWLFRGEPITENNNFLISAVGDRHILNVSNTSKDTEGSFTCVAENELGIASCSAALTVVSLAPITLPEPAELSSSVDSSFTMKREIHTESSTMMSSKVISSTIDSSEPQTKIHSFSSHDERTFKQVNQDSPEISEKHNVEEYLQLGNDKPIIHEKSSSTFSTEKQQTQIPIVQHTGFQKPIIKIRPPKFVTPVVGKIIDQNTTVNLEGIIDSQPTSTVTWTKNGKEITSSDRITTKWEFNKASLEIKDSTTSDGGRYTCTATNEAGTAVSTADLVVRKTIFPPVFGRRLQAQVIKKADRIVMEVEVTGTPEPTVTWFKDSVPIEQALSDNYKLKSFGNSHSLIIEKADLKHTGRYMVRAVNSGGEAQSIADIAVFEPTPDTMVEVVKTVVFEDVRKHETLATAADKISSTAGSTPAFVSSDNKINKPLQSHPTTVAFVPQAFENSSSISSKTEFSSFSEQTISQRHSTARLEYTAPEIPQPKPHTLESLEKQMDFQIVDSSPRPDLIDESQTKTDEGIQTSSISKESSLQYFVKKIEEHKDGEKEILQSKRVEGYKKFEPKQIHVEHKLPTLSSPLFPKLESSVPEQKSGLVSSEEVQHFELKPEPPAEICYSEPTIQKGSTFLKDKDYVTHGQEIRNEMYTTVETKQQITSGSSTSQSQTLPPLFTEPFVSSSKNSSTKEEKTFFLDDNLEKKFAKEFNAENTEISFPKPTGEEISRPKSPRPEALKMEKMWVPTRESDKSSSVILKQNTNVPPLTHQSISEKKIVTQTPPVHYIANVSHCIQPQEKQIETLFTKHEQSQESGIEKQYVFNQKTIFASQISEKLPQYTTITESVPVLPPKPYPAMDSLLIRPVSVQDITDEVILEPGSPPIIDYAQPPTVRRQSYVETVEHELEHKMETLPLKVPPGGVRLIPPALPTKVEPPPLPPKKEQPPAPPIPAKPIKKVTETTQKKFLTKRSSFNKFPELEPFPFRPEPEKPKHPRTGPPPTPSKFIKGKFTDSDYESDFESVRIPPKWKPCSSDNEEPSYRKVRAPKIGEMKRSRSTEPEPLPPSKFDHPPQFLGPPRPVVKYEQQKRTTQMMKKQISSIKQHQETKRISPPPIKPGSPPVYIENIPKKLDSPKTKRKIVIDGYMADTDEPFFQQKSNRSESHEISSNFSQHEYKSENLIESSQKFVSNGATVHNVSQPKKYTTSTTSAKKELTATPIITNLKTEKRHETFERNMEYIKNQAQTKTVKYPPVPSPSKFVKSEFRESDYESDYDKPIPVIWNPSGPDDSSHYRPVRPVLTPTGRKSQIGITPTPPTEFEVPSKMESMFRPKFEPIDKPKATPTTHDLFKHETKNVVFKPRAISANQAADISRYIPLRPGTPPELAYATGPQTQIYRSTTSMPYHNAVQTETSNIVRFKESNEKCHRTVSVEQSTKVIKFGEKQNNIIVQPQKFEIMRPKIKAPPPASPKKFIPGESKETDYESDIENIKIKPKWAPSGSDTEDLHYRSVRPPSSASRSSSVPPTRDYIPSPMDFDKCSHEFESSNNTERIENNSYSKTTSNKNFATRSRSHDSSVKRVDFQPCSPPEYGYISGPKFKSTATDIASHHMDNMTQSFKSKTQKFVRDIMNDVEQQSGPKKSILKSNDEKDAQVYREETRAAQYGTKHIDPDTGLIYFKYDFGYEFGIVLPGESKNGGIPVPPKTILQPPKRTADIEMPVYHEKTSQNKKSNIHKPANKNIKWEHTSESELSEYEGSLKRNNQGSRWEPSSCSPASLSPSLPSNSPAFSSSFAGSDKRRLVDTPPSCPGTPVNSQKGHTGQIRAPMFITPLRNIAVVNGQSAKFECIVQSEPSPSILWSKNGRIIQDSDDYQLHYRNGVCRLTISRSYPEDAGTYTCTATNPAGSASSTATLDVPGEIKAAYIK